MEYILPFNFDKKQINFSFEENSDYENFSKENSQKNSEEIFKYSINLQLPKNNKFEHDQKELINNLHKYFKNSEIKAHNFKISSIIDTLDIFPTNGISCNLCQRVLDNLEIKYFCFICNIYYCYECAMLPFSENKINNNNNYNKHSFEKLIHKEHYLICFSEFSEKNKNFLANISRYKFGFNLYSFLQEMDLHSNHNFGCDVCGHCNNGLHRYICLNCEEGQMQPNGFTDICENCFKDIHVEKNDALLNYKTHKKDHVYLWMVYSGENYYLY